MTHDSCLTLQIVHSTVPMTTYTHTHARRLHGSKVHSHKSMLAACLPTMLLKQADVHKLSGCQHSDDSSADAFKAITHNAVHQKR